MPSARGKPELTAKESDLETTRTRPGRGELQAVHRKPSPAAPDPDGSGPGEAGGTRPKDMDAGKNQYCYDHDPPINSEGQ